MHNILLGVTKTQWYEAWIKGNTLRESTEKTPRELDAIHDYLKAISIIWKEWLPAAKKQHQAKLDKWKSKKGEKPEEPKRRMHPDDGNNFLNLAAAMKIILARTIAINDIPLAKLRLQNYLRGFHSTHPELIKPNFHYITHIFNQILDYGPVYGFWTYLFERLNKILKSCSVNNHDGGELEVTFYREFLRKLNMISGTEHTEGLSVEERLNIDAARMILKTDTDDRGTVAALAQEIAEAAKE
ncbi:hypothetical protein PHLCEN_2v11495, partial [Hermanssonia centrifuga]